MTGKKKQVSLYEIKKQMENDEIEERWQKTLELRGLVNTKLETLKKEGFLKSSLEADLTVSSDFYNSAIDNYKEVFLVSSVVFENDVVENVQVSKSNGFKCPRCWNYHHDSEELCHRCESVLNKD